jgi:hypothetical protein
MQFDINPEWPTPITYRHHHGLGQSKAVPNVQQPAARYLVADDRDFLTVYVDESRLASFGNGCLGSGTRARAGRVCGTMIGRNRTTAAIAATPPANS